MIEKEIEKMTKDEKSLLLYFETCLVDKDGRIMAKRMNEIDFEIAKKWTKEKFVSLKGIPIKEVKNKGIYTETHTVCFSEKAFQMVYYLRKARALRHSKLLELNVK